MFLLRLFHQDDAAQPIGAHMLRPGVTSVGRDPAADWAIPDPECEISRHHLEFILSDGALTLRPLGANGVFRSGSDKRLADREEVALALGDAIGFGKYRMVVDQAPFDTRAGASFDRTMVFAPPAGGCREIPADWADGSEATTLSGEGSLLEAFCEGAKLDVSALSAEEPEEVMRRAGAIYRQMVLGLGELVNERSEARAALSMDRTTIGAEDNNPFKWAPTRRLATDLLLGREAGFLSGPEAIRSSFQDLRNHLHGILAGSAAAVRALLARLGPAEVETQAQGKTSILKGRAVSCWEEYRRMHADLDQQTFDGRGGAIGRAFNDGYEEWLRKATDGPAH
jgi:predicted component of type VI protein secretion system